MDDVELKKCPFCGSDTKVVEIKKSYGNVRIGGVEVICTGCHRMLRKHWTYVMYPR